MLKNKISAMWYGNPSAVCFIGSVIRLMEYIGDPVEEDEVFALSGVGLCFPWKFASFCDEVSVIPEIPKETFKAFGYESEYLTGEEVSDKNICLNKIKQSIDADRPVIGFGITEKMPMSCLIVGYDENGLYTRAFWQPNGEKYDSEEYFYSSNWYEKCSGLLFVGEKTGERLVGAAAYKHISDWALKFRCYGHSVKFNGQEIFINQYAFDEMIRWLKDDEIWQNPNENGKEQFLKQCGLLLFDHYRYQLYEYLKKLDAKYPNVVNAPVFGVLEEIGKRIPGAHTSDLWLHEAVDPVLSDFSAMKDKNIRNKVISYINMLKEFDNSVQWTLFMPDMVKSQQNGFKVDNFEYRKYSAMRFIGFEGEEYSDINLRVEKMNVLAAMTDYKSEFDYDILFMHHYGLEVNNPWHGVWGRFMKAGTPIPDGYIGFDFVEHTETGAGFPFLSEFAYAVFSGDMDKMHQREGYDSDAMYDVTRNIILGDGVCIPYPEKYWSAEVFLNGCDKYSTGYLFSVDVK